MKGRHIRVVVLAMSLGCTLAFALGASAARAADEEPQAFARVIVDSAELRTGPSISYRVLYTAHRGETFALDGRPGSGFWLRVLLPDGRAAYAVGDEVQPFAVTPGEEGAPSRPGLFAPPPLEGSRAGFAMIGGILVTPVADGSIQRYGYVELRPSIVVHKTVTLDGFFGDALTSDGSELLYGGGVTIHLTPSWPLSPFVGIAAGGLSVFPNSDSFVLKRQDEYVARAGGGVLFALRNRILVRLEANNLSLFTPNSYKNAQVYVGGLGVYF